MRGRDLLNGQEAGTVGPMLRLQAIAEDGEGNEAQEEGKQKETRHEKSRRRAGVRISAAGPRWMRWLWMVELRIC
jgi:hypothetical protein